MTIRSASTASASSIRPTPLERWPCTAVVNSVSPPAVGVARDVGEDLDRFAAHVGDPLRVDLGLPAGSAGAGKMLPSTTSAAKLLCSTDARDMASAADASGVTPPGSSSVTAPREVRDPVPNSAARRWPTVIDGSRMQSR